MKKRILILMKVGLLNQRMNQILMNIQIILDRAIEQLGGIDASASRVETASSALARL